jgi:hypothetical protein
MYAINFGYKHFFYDIFKRGDLRMVADTTYTLDSGPRGSDFNFDTNRRRRTFDTHFNSKSLMQFGNTTNVLLIRGEELHDNRIKIDINSKTGQQDKRMFFSKNKTHCMDLCI